MFRRKMDERLSTWRADPFRVPLVISGVRGCGKTATVRAFARSHYDSVVWLNFRERPELASIFDGALDAETLTMKMRPLLGASAEFAPGRTLLVMDEAERCPEVHTSLKFFRTDGRYDVIVILSGPWQGACSSVPVGSERCLQMRPLDLEEFLWACGVSAEETAAVGAALEAETPLAEDVLSRWQRQLARYAATGGMPTCVETLLRTERLSAVRSEQKRLLEWLVSDLAVRSLANVWRRSAACLQSVPAQLAKPNRKFQYALLEKGARSEAFDAVWEQLAAAGLATRCFGLSGTALPLDLQATKSSFRVFLNDVGLFAALLPEKTQRAMLAGDFSAPGVAESLAADFFIKAERRFYFFRRSSGLDLDFVIRWKGRSTPVEVHARTENAKALKTVLAQPETYGVTSAVRLEFHNVSRSGAVLSLPFFMGCFLTKP